MRILSFICISIGILMFFACVGCGKLDEAPKQAFLKFQDTMSKKDWPGLWDMLSNDDHTTIESMYNKMKDQMGQAMKSDSHLVFQEVPGTHMTYSEFMSKPNKELFVSSGQFASAGGFGLDASQIKVASNDGKTAALALGNCNGNKGKFQFYMVKEDGVWKVAFFRTMTKVAADAFSK